MPRRESAQNPLVQITSFGQLLPFLEDQLGWPLQQHGFDDLTFEYIPSELGLKDEDATQVKSIHQLRPLHSGQPWGIFFVEFEKKKLPVVVLRRILSHLVLKKRASANKADRAAWVAEDLLFISAFGASSGADREIAFAHFHETPGDLPTLQVLGWDGRDTPLKMDHVAGVLRDRLKWPANTRDTTAWRSQWQKAFRHRIGHVIRTADSLAETLAGLARSIRESCRSMMRAETERGPLTKLFKAFQGALIHDLTAETFADTYAQTITYGLVTAAISRTDMSAGAAGTFVKADDIAEIVPVTNPFLKEMLQTFLKVGGRKGGIDFDELGIQDVVELLRGEETDLPAILRDFDNRNPNEDPVIHFYEHFLAAYDKELKIKRGVFYTPKPVVSYIVRSVDELLQTEFGLELGLASSDTWADVTAKMPAVSIPAGTSANSFFVQILDPAVGTATFLVEVIDIIYRRLKAVWESGGMQAMPRLPSVAFARYPDSFAAYWNQYVPLALLPRLHGYELMMAPYAIAHMKIGLKLFETGYRFGSDERARIYLTNSLEPPQDFSDRLAFDAPALAHEAEAVNKIKRHTHFTVVIGNPPYAGLSANLTDTARALVARFKFIDGVRIAERGALQLERNLNDDYIKFLAFSEDCLNETALGICGMICNHGFIDNPTLRGVRWSLLKNFRRIWVLDLHGNVNRRESAPDGSPDENVFDIKDAGVAIYLGVRGDPEVINANRIQKHDLWGDRDKSKYPFLAENSFASHEWESVRAEPELFLFRILSKDGANEYATFPKVTEIFPLHSIGMITARDAYVIDFDREPLVERAKAFRNSKLSDEATCEALGIPIKKGWNIRRARERIRSVKDLAVCIQRVLYRPFDVRFVFYHESLIWGMARPVMQHMVGGKNLALITSRMTKGENFQHVLVSNTISEVILLSSKTSNNAFAFPLHLRSDTSDLQFGDRVNLAPQFLSSLAQKLKLKLSKNGLPDGLAPDDIFNYAYAMLQSPAYRSRYAEFLKIDFPRLPLTESMGLFRALGRLGGELVGLHLLESPKVDRTITEYLGGRLPEVEKVSWSKNTVWVDKAQTTGFKGVREDVWNFHIGGYQVCEKWLKDRKGRKLLKDDIDHYQKIVVALSETIRLMREIDQTIEKHGGWPGAFITNQKGAAS